MSDLTLNPHLTVRPIVADGKVVAYSLNAPVRGRGHLYNRISSQDASPEVLCILAALAGADTDLEIYEAEWPILGELGVLLHEHEISTGARFSCRLETPPVLNMAELELNTAIRVVTFDDLVLEFPDLARLLDPCDHVAVVRDPVTGVPYPYCLNITERALVHDLVDGALDAADLEDGDRAVLAHAGILLDRVETAHRRDRVLAAVTQFERDAYVELPSLVPPLQRAALSRYYGALLAEGFATNGDAHVRDRAVIHNERLAQYYHQQLSGLIAKITCQSIKPSYSYFAAYRRGAVLPKHVDRPQCKFTISLLLDYASNELDDHDWPLYIEKPATREQTAINLRLGDGVLFSGCELPHYRHALRAEHSMSLFLHYVESGFSGSLR